MLADIKSPKDLKRLKINELKSLCEEIRRSLIDIVSVTGGHIGPNLGALELTVALHYVFNSPNDTIAWDVGHQCYVHKMLTGRREQLKTMRLDGGMIGFPSRAESEHDIVNVSHAGTSIGTALGVAIANRLTGRNELAIAVIGDGSLSEGMALEALNHLGTEKVRMLVILNDNSMAIDPTVGAIHNHLKQFVPGGSKRDTFFSSLGLDYVGPIDGHDIEGLVITLKKLRDIKTPTMLHVKTIKARTLDYADKSPIRLHWSFPFDKETGELRQTGTDPRERPSGQGTSVAVGQKMLEILKADKRVVLITPATRAATDLSQCFVEVPARCIDVGLEEQHAVTLAAGLSLRGIKPVVCFQSAFLPRAFDQIIHDICENELPVLFLVARSGLAGLDSPTHHANLDLSYLSAVPNLRIIFPSRNSELLDTLEKCITNLQEPTAILFPYGRLPKLEPQDEANFELLGPDLENPANQGIILTVANRLKSGVHLKKLLAEEEVEFAMENITELKPLNQELLSAICKRYSRIVTIEENVSRGGFGSTICTFVCDHGFRCDVLRISFPDSFIPQGTRPYLYLLFGIDDGSILSKIHQRWPDLFQKG